MTEKNITINREYYDNLKKRDQMLYFLEKGGVSKWSGYRKATKKHDEFVNKN